MSPQGGKQASRKGGGKGASGRVEARRLGLLVFGVSFVLLFAIVAIAQGIGNPSVPDGDVAVVEDAPGDTGKVTQERFDRALEQAATQGGVEEPPKPGDEQYEQLRDSALNSLFETIWLQGLADEMGISVGEKRVQSEFRKLKDENFSSEREYKKFLKDSNFTQEDVNERVKLQVLSTEIQQELQDEVPEPSEGEVERYYEAAKTTQFTQPPSRSVRMILNEDRQKAQRARNQLNEDNTQKSWNRLAKRLSEDDATKDSGGLQEGITEGTLDETLDAAVFGAPEGQIEGPIETDRGFYVFEVQNSSPESVQELSEVEAQIQSQLAQQAQQDYFNGFVSNFNSLWQSRTYCVDGYVSERCANFQPDGRPATAPPGCYEADPEGGPPDACPAPVFQLIPAMPGSVTVLEPQGTPLAQRPQPAGGDEEEAPAGLPPGFSPDGAAPPPAE